MTTHTLVCGETRSGKTYFANQMHRQFPRVSIFWNHQATRNIWGHRCNAPGRLLRTLAHDKKVDYHPSSDRDQARSELEDVVDTLFDVAQRSDWKGGDPWCQVIVDEAGVYDRGQSKTDPVEKLATRGLNRHGIRLVAITQYPPSLKTVTRDQLATKVVFRMGDQGRMAMRNWGWPADQIEEWTHAARYNHCIYTPGRGWTQHTPI